jgi:predicted small metal-binding protein
MLLFIANLYLPLDPGRSMKSLSCREAGCDCDYIATGQTEEELMGKLREHGMKEHGKTEEDMMQMKDKLKSSIRSS